MAIKTSANVILPRRDVDQQVEGELTNLLFANTRGLHLTTIAAAALMTWLFWFALSHAVLLLWASYMSGTALGRAWLARRFRKTEIPLDGMQAWLRWFRYGNLLSGIGWGSAGILLYVPGDAIPQLMLTVIIFAVLAVAVSSLAANRQEFAVFALLSLAPLLLRHLLDSSSSSLITAALLTLLFPLLAGYALRAHRQMVESLQMRFAYADLARELSGEVAVRRQAEHRLIDMANYDQLTGLPNRALLRDRMEQAFAKARRHDRKVAVLFTDLDRFKQINDSMGHHAGDDVLRTISKRLQQCLRAENTVARLSGDEFIIVIEDVEKLDELRAIARRILMEVSEPLRLDENTEIKLTASIGIALYPDHGRETDALLQNADIAMYRAKTNGRNTFQIFSPDMHAEALTRLSRENALRRALENDEFYLAYQPQVDTFSGGFIGVEALLRWESPEYGSISPAEFIPLAEDTGLIVPLGEWVLRNACEQAKRFRKQYGREFHMGINLSVRQLETHNILERIAAIIEETGVEPDSLMFEITESVTLSNAHSNLTVLRKLRAMGVRLALDDFGTGNSSLTYLKRFPINCVKLDKTFIDNITANREDAAIARATIQLANELELMVIAEGVESRDQAEWLQAQNCFLMQGYLFSTPLKAHECAARLALHNALDLRESHNSV